MRNNVQVRQFLLTHSGKPKFQMANWMKFVILATVICCSLIPAVAADWGDWGAVEYCPQGEVAVAFQLKVDTPNKSDNTALNAISLKCSGGKWITSREGPFGNWEDSVFSCDSGDYIEKCQLQVQPFQGTDKDDTAANSLNCRCRFYNRWLIGGGSNWGDWSDWSRSCSEGIIGIKTKVQEFQGAGDDTGLNDVSFVCKK